MSQPSPINITFLQTFILQESENEAIQKLNPNFYESLSKYIGDLKNEEYAGAEEKIKIIHGKFNEKDEQCKAYMQFINHDIDYLWNLDSDEIYKPDDIETIIKLLEDEQYTSVGIRSCSFYGGFDDYIGGFELNKDNFLRIFKVYKGATWKTHRPPTIIAPEGTKTLPKKKKC